MKCKHSHCFENHGDMPCNCFTTTSCDLCGLGDSVEFEVTKECKHQFFETCKGTYHSEDSRYSEGVFIGIQNHPNGVIVMCALCGERRHLHTDGRVEILNKEV